MQRKVMSAAIAIAAAAVLAAAPARADRQSVCEDLDGLWSDRSEFIQITGRAACELTPETPGGSLLQLQFEYPTDVADDTAAGKQLESWIKTRIGFYQKQFVAEGDQREIAVGVTFDEPQPAAATRTVVFTETAFTKGNPQPVTQKLTQSFALAAPIPSAPPSDGTAPESAIPAPGPEAPTSAPDGSAPVPAAPPAPGAVAPVPAAPAPRQSAPISIPRSTPTPSARPLR